MMNPPQRCPFCGSAGYHVVPAAQWKNYGAINMSEQSRKNCEKAVYLELGCYEFYKCCASNAENQVIQAIFERLMDQELEHAEVFATALGINVPKSTPKSCYDIDFQNMIAANKNEWGGITFYTESGNSAIEPRIQQIFLSIAEVENEHLMLLNTYLQR